MHITTLLNELHTMETTVLDKGYRAFFVSLTLDPTDRDCRLAVSYDTPYGASVWLRHEDSYASYSPDKLPEVLAGFHTRLQALRPWEETKAEEAIGELARAMDRVAALSETAFTAEQLSIISSMREEMQRLSGNALEGPK